MKITYTNLQENDSGTKRSVRQLRVDFSGSAKEQACLAEGGKKDAAGRDGRFLSFDAESSGHRNAQTGSGTTLSEETEGDGERTGGLQGDISHQAGGDAKSVAHILVRKFVEAQLRSACIIESRGMVNITI